MRVRVKLSKTGELRYIGHLDLMRYFQKAMRRAQVPIAFSGGYSPHMIMSFANPLGVGLTSHGEYFDMELTKEADLKAIEKSLNQVMIDGIHIETVTALSDEAKKGMSVISAADYTITWDGSLFNKIKLTEQIQNFLSLEEIFIVKKTKKSEKEVNIRPFIYVFRYENDCLFLQVAAGSVENLKPGLVMKAFCRFLQVEAREDQFHYCREELYARANEKESEKYGNWIPLYKLR